MTHDPAKMIELWFVSHADDSEFVCHARSAPFSVIGPLGGNGRVVFTTKPSTCAAAFEECEYLREFGMIGRYGLPSPSDVRWIRNILESRSLWFLGDMDPVDLMVFLWLREQLAPTRVIHLGINDAFLTAIGASMVEVLSIPLAVSEQQAIKPLVELFPDVATTIGAECSRILYSGHKVELEAAMSARSPGSLLRVVGLCEEDAV